MSRKKTCSSALVRSTKHLVSKRATRYEKLQEVEVDTTVKLHGWNGALPTRTYLKWQSLLENRARNGVGI